MPADTYSVKASEETQERIKTLINESGLNGKDFFINLLSIYETQKAKENTPIIAADIEELESLTRRINGIFVNASERINTLQRESTEERERQAETNQSTIELLQRKINEQEQDRLHDEERIQGFIDDREQAEQRAAELQTRIKELEQAATDKQLLIDEYKEKLDAQTSIVAEYRQSAEEARAIQKENAELTAKIQDTERRLDALNEKTNRQNEQHTADMERLKDTLNIEREKALLELRTEHQKDLQEQQTEYSHKINEYEATVRSLLEQIQDSKTAPKAAVGTNRKKAPANKKATGGAEPTDPTNE